MVMYLWLVYHSAAEPMPTDPHHSLQKPTAKSMETPFPESTDGPGADGDEISRRVNAFMTSLHTYNSDIEVHLVGPGTFKGERRDLQQLVMVSEDFAGFRTGFSFFRGTLYVGGSLDRGTGREPNFSSNLAHCSATSQVPASYQTFLRVASKVLGPHIRTGHLHFRKAGDHAKCDVCTKLKKQLRLRNGVAGGNEAAVRSYSSHILSQWLDRQIYWSYRTLSQTFFRQQEMEIGER